MLFLFNAPREYALLTEGERHWFWWGVKGEPRPTEKHTAEELKKMGFVGYYDPKREEEPEGAPR